MVKSAYEDVEVLEFLNSLVRRSVLELRPTLEMVGVRYLEAEKESSKPPGEIEAWLETMAEQGVFERRYLNRVLFCPVCRSSCVWSYYTCKRCGSSNVERVELLEHIKCGYMSSRKDFTRSGKPVCPGCKTQLVAIDVDHRLVGECYECFDCGHRTDAPSVIHNCGNCQKSFTYREAVYTRLVAYRISEDALKKIGVGVTYLAMIRRILKECGFDARIRSSLKGASGNVHNFDIIAEKGGFLLVIDVSSEGREEDLLRLLGKKIDTKPAASLLVTISNYEGVSSLGKVYGISVIRAGSEGELESNLRAFLKGRRDGSR